MLIRQRLAGLGVDLRLKHRYHDRAEVTEFLHTA
jgi:23S rRNA C2498 (ribose-2'-O)-methylase RlmM